MAAGTGRSLFRRPRSLFRSPHTNGRRNRLRLLLTHAFTLVGVRAVLFLQLAQQLDRVDVRDDLGPRGALNEVVGVEMPVPGR